MAKRKQQTDYEIGHGKPPKQSQFPKGVSGNPSGRPKGSGSLAAAIRRQGEMMSPIKLDGQPASFYELVARRLYHDGAQGNLKAIAQILKADPARPVDVTEGDQEIEVTLVLEDIPPLHIRLNQIENFMYFKEHPELLEEYPELRELYPELVPQE